VRRARAGADIDPILVGQLLEARGVAAEQGEQLFGALYAEPVGGRVIALHLPAQTFVEGPIPSGNAGKEHAGHSENVRGSAEWQRGERLHFGNASFAAMVGEYGPVAPAESLFERSQIDSGSGHGAFGNQPVVTENDRVRRLAPHP